MTNRLPARLVVTLLDAILPETQHYHLHQNYCNFILSPTQIVFVVYFVSLLTKIQSFRYIIIYFVILS